MERFDLVIIGAGPGGYTAAQKAAEGGLKVAIVEKGELGGTCVNRGCIPTKAMIHAAEVYADMKNSRMFGITATEVTYDSGKVYEYKEHSVKQFRDDLEASFEKLGITVYHGKAALLRDKCVRVEIRYGEEIELTGENIILAVGAKPMIPDIPGNDLKGVVTSDELLSSETDNYDDVIIIGGGVVGVECGNILHGFGSKVTILEQADRILSPMDPEISWNLSQYIERAGVDIHTNSKVLRIEKEEKLRATFVENGETRQVSADHILVSIGRRSALPQLFSPGLDMVMDQGRVQVDGNFETSIPGVYVIGDALDGIKLAHVAAAQATFVVEHILKMTPSIMLSIVPSCLFMELPIVPSCIYLNPEVASVGLSEAEARERGLHVKCGKYNLSENGKAIISQDSVGFVKVVFEANSDVLIGAQMVCSRATDMIGEMATAIANSLTSPMLLYAMRAHPTYSEAIARAVEDSRREK